MGYNTWYDFMCNNINAANIMAVADKMVELGLLEIGYNYLNIDDCWAVGRMSNGTLIPDPTAFPDGMKAVVDYVHGKVRCVALYCHPSCGARASSLASTRTVAT